MVSSNSSRVVSNFGCFQMGATLFDSGFTNCWRIISMPMALQENEKPFRKWHILTKMAISQKAHKYGKKWPILKN